MRCKSCNRILTWEEENIFDGYCEECYNAGEDDYYINFKSKKSIINEQIEHDE
jgi:hypothetical protein